LAITVAPNDGASRRGTIRVGPGTLTVTQTGCAYRLAPPSLSFGAAGGSGGIEVATGSACPWTPSASESWIDPTSGGRRGSGSVSFAVAPNSGAAREGKVLVGGQSTAVLQAPRAACPKSVSPSSQAIPASGGSFKFTVTADADCTWTPKPSADWIGLETGQGTGSTSGAYVVRPNTGAQRSATLQFGGQSISISQACDLGKCGSPVRSSSVE
jgi:hypothetical protein